MAITFTYYQAVPSQDCPSAEIRWILSDDPIWQVKDVNLERLLNRLLAWLREHEEVLHPVGFTYKGQRVRYINPVYEILGHAAVVTYTRLLRLVGEESEVTDGTYSFHYPVETVQLTFAEEVDDLSVGIQS